MDLDDILDDVMGEPVVAVVPVKPPVVKKVAESAEIKPWLASTANVPPESRDRWTKLVRQDLSAVPATPFQPSYAYRNWWDASGTPSSNKVLQELVRKAATKCGFDDAQTAKLLNTSNPITDSESGGLLQKAYARQLIADLKGTIVKDPNYSAAKFPALAAIIDNKKV